MEFLRPLYEDELNEEGDVEIVGLPFQRSRILTELEPDAFNATFEDWLVQRKLNCLEKASEILDLFDNRNRFEQLQRTFDNDKVMPFLGAGISMASGYPSWTGFLFEACEESHVTEAELDTLLGNGQYEEAAQTLHDDMTATGFNEILELVYKSKKEIYGAIHYLPKLFSKSSVITTNFDDLIEKIFNDADQTFDQIKSGRALNEVLRLIPMGNRLLIKLHGNCDLVAERVLLKSEYDEAYADGNNVRNFFNRILFGQSLLFIGCSLTVDRTIQAMIKVVEEHGAETLPRHYAFLELKNGDDRLAKKKELLRANIFPIWYSEGEHEESIEALFTLMLEG
ncbi:MAG: SIR2 family protein [Flavobacteriales bacterium]|nr:SIR2 family protein [Flavobacteriales bacterium]